MITLPEIVTQRDQHWHSPTSAPLKLQQEMSDWAWEKWDAGQLDITLPPPLQRDMVELKHIKDDIFPSTEDKLEEEFDEVIEARGFDTKQPVTRGLLGLSRSDKFTKQDWEKLTYGLNMPDTPINQYLQYAVLKLQGRVATNIVNPEATSEDIKDALRDYEDDAAGRIFSVSV